MVRSKLWREDRGATAIEYALVAGLIAAGLIGSLVGTRTSLNANFNSAATGLTSGPAATPISRSAYWQAKTLTKAPVTVLGNGYAQTSFSYTDGSQVMILKNYDGSPATYAIGVLSPDHLTATYAVYDFNGVNELAASQHISQKPMYFESTYTRTTKVAGYDVPWDLGFSPVSVTTSTSFTNGVPNSVAMTSYNSNGSFAGNSSPPVTQDVIDRNTSIMQDFAYFKAYKTI